MAKQGLRGKTRPSFHHIWDKVSKPKHCSFHWFCSSMSLNPAALNHHICPRGLSSTHPAHTNTFTLCKTYSGFCRPVFKLLHIKVRRNISTSIPAGDKPGKAPSTSSVFLLLSSSPALPKQPPPSPPSCLRTSDSVYAHGAPLSNAVLFEKEARWITSD